MVGVHELTLKAADGREKRILAWFPTDAVRQDFCEEARKRGLKVIEHEIQKSVEPK